MVWRVLAGILRAPVVATGLVPTTKWKTPSEVIVMYEVDDANAVDCVVVVYVTV